MPKFGTDEATDAKESPADSFGIRPQIGGLSGWTAGWTMTGCSGRPAATSGPGHPSERQSGFWTLITSTYHTSELAATDRRSVQLTAFRPPMMNRPKIAQSGEADATSVLPAYSGHSLSHWLAPPGPGFPPGRSVIGNAVSALL